MWPLFQSNIWTADQFHGLWVTQGEQRSDWEPLRVTCFLPERRPAMLSLGLSAVHFARQRQLKKKKNHFRQLTFQKEHLFCHLLALSGDQWSKSESSSIWHRGALTPDENWIKDLHISLTATPPRKSRSVHLLAGLRFTVFEWFLVSY